MDNSNVELITKMVLEAVEKQECCSVWRRFSRSNRSVRKTYPSDTGACRRFCSEKDTILQSTKNLWADSLHQTRQVTIVGLKLKSNRECKSSWDRSERISQVEISATDAISLGVKAPIRESGNIAGSAPIAISRTKRCGVSERGMHCCEETYSHGSERCDGSRSS